MKIEEALMMFNQVDGFIRRSTWSACVFLVKANPVTITSPLLNNNTNFESTDCIYMYNGSNKSVAVYVPLPSDLIADDWMFINTQGKTYMNFVAPGRERDCERSDTHALTLNEYQNMAAETNTVAIENMFVYTALGLNGEAGEVADKVKKLIRDKDGDRNINDDHDIILELGDVLWYVAMMAKYLGYDLEEVAKLNYDKLKSRQKRNKIKGNGDHR